MDRQPPRTERGRAVSGFTPIGELAAKLVDQATDAAPREDFDAASYWALFDANADRQAAASRLIDAAMGCGDDAARFLEIALNTFRPGMPTDAGIDLQMEAAHWVQLSTRGEQRALFWAIWQDFTPEQRESFLTWAQGDAA